MDTQQYGKQWTIGQFSSSSIESGLDDHQSNFPVRNAYIFATGERQPAIYG